MTARGHAVFQACTVVSGGSQYFEGGSTEDHARSGPWAALGEFTIITLKSKKYINPLESLRASLDQHGCGGCCCMAFSSLFVYFWVKDRRGG